MGDVECVMGEDILQRSHCVVSLFNNYQTTCNQVESDLILLKVP